MCLHDDTRLSSIETSKITVTYAVSCVNALVTSQTQQLIIDLERHR